MRIASLRFLSGLFFLFFAGSLAAQFQFIRVPDNLVPEVICEGVPENAFYSVPAPEGWSKRLKSGVKHATIEVTYTGFSEQAKTAFQYAVDIWSTLIYSPVTIHIDARWEVLNTGVLGNCAPSSYYIRLDGARDPGMFYPVSLAEKIAERDLNGVGNAEIVARFSSSIPWSYATDGTTVPNKYNLTTVVLHEICHGLGYVGSFTIYNSLGYYGSSDGGRPAIFDKYIGNSSGSMLIDSNLFTQASKGLAGALVSDKLYFFSEMAYNLNGLKYPKLYAPTLWNGGSSIYHLDDLRYDKTPNALMTHAVNYAEVVLDPGPLSMAMLHEMGWINTWIRHKALRDVESVNGPLAVKATITSDSAINPNTIYLHYSTDGFSTEVSSPMSSTGKAFEYESSILLSVPEMKTDYYITVEDVFGRKFYSPAGVPWGEYHSFYYGADTVLPVIKHQPVKYMLEGMDSLKITAQITDNLGIRNAFVEYAINGAFLDSVPLVKDSLDYYSGNLLFTAVNLQAGDTVTYRIAVLDSAFYSNLANSPETGFNTVPVEAVPTAQTSYYNNFNTPDNDFLLDGFSITEPDWFYSPALHTAHPYTSPRVDGGELNFTAQLRYPIIVQPEGNAYITFYEIALVEPGEAGAVFPSSSFYDYVVVEGSVNNGGTWQPITDGWDCRAYPEWNTRYNSRLDASGSSLATTDYSLYKKRVIDLYEHNLFKSGDTILIRFKLHSDPYANGWGWVIENLGIQGVYTDLEDGFLLPENLAVFPNPASDYLTVKLTGITGNDPIRISLLNLLGQVCAGKSVRSGELERGYRLELPSLNPGIYQIVITGKEVNMARKVFIQSK